MSKKTQGSVKMLQFLQDLGRNKDFQEAMAQLNESLNKISVRGSEYRSQYSEIGRKYRVFVNEAEEQLEKVDFGYSKKSEAIMDKFDVDKNLREIAANDYLLPTSKEKSSDTGVDMCTIQDTSEDLYIHFKGGVPAFLDPSKVAHSYLYGVSIDIHKMASKRDVLDFIEKHWKDIEYRLRYNEKPRRFRARKHSREIVDLIWEKRAKTAKAIKTILDEKYPGNRLIYTDIAQILRSEKKRRLEDLT